MLPPPAGLTRSWCPRTNLLYPDVESDRRYYEALKDGDYGSGVTPPPAISKSGAIKNCSICSVWRGPWRSLAARPKNACSSSPGSATRTRSSRYSRRADAASPADVIPEGNGACGVRQVPLHCHPTAPGRRETDGGQAPSPAGRPGAAALHPGLPLDQALAIAGQVCLALGHAYGHGIVHRDLKPGNVWLAVRDLRSSQWVLELGVLGSPRRGGPPEPSRPSD